ncbi:ribosome 60S biogenesis N-terminal-domain-containing protein [Thelonectria olida]|uniref:Ribosome 60S biogenesis N-terminal-domain-containing protein n=1 Tax=Thelonectria olida TaxID=1576542 RepID=A0A9P9AWA7_9HYPO|nr:ribosome 60S biogenesis N-terminal-domain-containing protein [Thelonectria olida]
MGKRASSGPDGATAFRKRQKVVHEAPTSEEVTSSGQLRRLLSFDQDLRNARHGLQSFKNLLDQIVSDDGQRRANLEILRQYLESVKPKDTSEDGVYLSDIMEMWSFSVQVNNEGVMSAVAVVLALVLQIVSGSLDLVRHGLGICQSILQERQLKSLSKNLSLEKSKGFVISPTLRMLREAVCLDGGAYAKRIFRARNSTLASLGRNLEVGHMGDGQEDAKRATVRTNAVRFFLSLLKYLHSDGRKELLAQRELLSHLTFMIKTDPPYLVKDILESLKTHVLMDNKIPRDVKFRSFNTKTLVRFLALHTYTADSDVQDETATVSYKAHKFLIYVCTTSTAGILYPSTGLYPKESDDGPLGHVNTGSANNAFLVDKYKDDIPVYNFVLAEFAQKLRPWSSMTHSELLVAIFTAAPELIAKYFLTNKSFTFEPKLSMTWIGYAAFLFNTMRIPLPPHFGDRIRSAKAPPPTSLLLDNIIPLPINQKVVIRCLSNKSHLTSFFATRILIVALEKLTEALKMLDGAPKTKSGVWAEARRRLIDAFCQRIPDMKEIVRSYKGIPSENILHRMMTARLLRLYYEVIPQVALAANFDVSPLFTEVLKKLNKGSEKPEDESLIIMELENLVSIASYSPGMRWFSRIENLVDGAASSPYTALLRTLSDKDRELPFQQLKQVLGEVAIENQLVTRASLLTPLVGALQNTSTEVKDSDMEKIWSFLDNCISRCASSPIKYLDLMEMYIQEGGIGSSNGAAALLNVTMAEQLSFFLASAKSSEQSALARFFSLYFNTSYSLKQARPLTKALYKRIGEQFSKTVKLGSLKADKSTKVDIDEDMVDVDEMTGEEAEKSSSLDLSKLEELLHVPVFEKEDTSALTKWTTKNTEDLIEDGWAVGLIRLLSSTHINIRKEAFTNILKMAAKIKESPYEEKEQIWLLLSELAESSRGQVDVGPVPSTFTAFAIHAFDVLKNPLHPLYPKVNSFLTRGPVWSLDKLPMAHDILHGEPSEDDKYYTEITWLLAYLLDSLRTPFDLGIFHKKRWFEKIVVLGGNPYLRSNLRTRVLRLLYRATCIEGGSTTLVTRFGILSWLDAQRVACEVADDADVLGALMKRVWETCDQDKVMAWSKGGAKKIIAALK